MIFYISGKRRLESSLGRLGRFGICPFIVEDEKVAQDFAELLNAESYILVLSRNDARIRI
jgi:hypothetical protein